MSAWKGCWLGLLGFGPLQRYPNMSWSDIQRRMKTAPHHDGHPHLINQSMGLTETFFFFPKTKQNKTKRKKKERKRKREERREKRKEKREREKVKIHEKNVEKAQNEYS